MSRLQDTLSERIRQEILPSAVPGERLPGVREIGERFGGSTATVVHAYRQLADDGQVIRRHGSGYYLPEVASPTETGRPLPGPQTALQRAQSLVAELAGRLAELEDLGLVQDRKGAAMSLRIPFQLLSELTGVHAEFEYDTVIADTDLVQVNHDGTVEADLPGGWSVIEWATDPDIYPAALSGVLDRYESGAERVVVTGEYTGDVWADVIEPVLSPNEHALPENSDPWGSSFVHARNLFYRTARGNWAWVQRDEQAGIPDSPSAIGANRRPELRG